VQIKRRANIFVVFPIIYLYAPAGMLDSCHTVNIEKRNPPVTPPTRPRGLGSILTYFQGSIPAWESLGLMEELPAKAGSEECIACLRGWLKECLEKHERCSRTMEAPLPKRVVYVGCDDTSIRLEEPQNMIAPYAALSHCWGEKQPLTTTRAKLPLRMRNIEWDSMPATFQDATKLTRQLGLKYLWIDSLCIIQDDLSDWDVESSTMGSIYEGAQVVIAANKSSGPEIPFLGLRHTGDSLELQFKRPDGEQVSVKARPAASFSFQEPLETRSWAFQEQWLSRRLLRFTANEVIWKCRSTTRCECRSGHTASPYMSGDDDEWLPRPETQSSPSEWFHRWHAAVSLYTTKKLTRDSDKLPALSGIAATMSAATNSTYVAGLWKDNILFDLQWGSLVRRIDNRSDARSDALSRIPKPTPTYRAPTFSWASIDAEIIYRADAQNGLFYRHDDDEDDEDDICLDSSVIDANCVLKGSNRFGEVSDGFIILKGPLIQACLSFDVALAYNPNLYRLDYSNLENVMQADISLANGIGKTDTGETGESVRRALPGEDPTSVKGPVWCLSLYHRANGEGMALVLGLSGRVAGAYERLGKVFWKAPRVRGTEPNVEWGSCFEDAEEVVLKIV
jgi:hypothetical protein